MSHIGVLAVQGAFREHIDALSGLGVRCFEIRKASDLDGGAEGLVLPGGESTVMGKLIRDLGMFDTLKGMVSSGVPVMGTCAGLILLAEGVEGGMTHLGTLPWGASPRRGGSPALRTATGRFSGVGEVPLEFIRAPMITRVGEGTEVLCECGGIPVAVRHGNQLAMSFHPELTADRGIHRYFLDMVG